MFHVLWWYFAKKNAAETLHQLSYSKGCCRIIEFSQWPMASQPTSPTVTTARNQAFLNPYIFLKGVRSGGLARHSWFVGECQWFQALQLMKTCRKNPANDDVDSACRKCIYRLWFEICGADFRLYLGKITLTSMSQMGGEKPPRWFWIDLSAFHGLPSTSHSFGWWKKSG